MNQMNMYRSDSGKRKRDLMVQKLFVPWWYTSTECACDFRIIHLSSRSLRSLRLKMGSLSRYRIYRDEKGREWGIWRGMSAIWLDEISIAPETVRENVLIPFACSNRISMKGNDRYSVPRGEYAGQLERRLSPHRCYRLSPWKFSPPFVQGQSA